MRSWYGDAGGSKHVMIRALGMTMLAALSGPAWGPFLGPSWSPFGTVRGALDNPNKPAGGPEGGPKRAPRVKYHRGGRLVPNSWALSGPSWDLFGNLLEPSWSLR